MSRPKIVDVEATIRIALTCNYIGNKEIQEMFGHKSSQTLARIKKEVRAVEAEEDIPVVVLNHVCREVAFRVWGIDVDELIEGYQRLQKLKMI